jgi:hypothetical protein
MSGLPPKANIVQHGGNVRFVPKADSCTAAYDRRFRTDVDIARREGAGSQARGGGGLGKITLAPPNGWRGGLVGGVLNAEIASPDTIC